MEEGMVCHPAASRRNSDASTLWSWFSPPARTPKETAQQHRQGTLPNFEPPTRRILMASKASAVWTGSLKEGKGTISTATGVLNNANYSFATRFEGADTGTTPEELIAAAHASCFSMALGAQLGGSGLTPESIETHAAVTLAKTDGGFSITKIALTTTAKVPGASKDAFDKAAADAKAGCPVSKLFANNTDITLDAKLV
jgi:osmotically inducible protein OsmC